MTIGVRTRLATLLGAAALSACTTLPRSGPTGPDISHTAAATHQFAIVNLDADTAVGMAAAPAGPTPLAALPPAGDPELIGVGDVLSVTVYEVGPALFSGRSSGAFGATAAAPAGNGELLPPMTVGSDGAISVPWAGRLVVRGITPAAAGEAIRRRLAGLSQNPQVVVTVRESIANTVMVLGDVRKPGRVPLSLAGERLLDAIALAGGTINPLQDNRVEVHRGPAAAVAPLSTVEAGSADDVRLMPQDRIVIAHQPRSFTVFGATNRVSEVPFERPRVSLAEAIAHAGGPSDTQADPRSVFLFRFEPALPDGSPAPDARAVAYRLNMMDARAYFVAQRVDMRPRDVIYIANAQANVPTKLIQIFNLFFSPVITARAVTR